MKNIFILSLILSVFLISGCNQQSTKIQVASGNTSLGCNMYIDDKGIYRLTVCEPGINMPCNDGEKTYRPDLDVNTFKVLDDNYSLDKNNVYSSCAGGEIVKEADPSTFYIYQKDRILARDKNYVFYNNNIVIGADPDTYSSITSSFDRDKNHVYFVGKKITDANPNYFKSISYSIGYDNKNIYNDTSPIYEIDYDSFSQINDLSWKDKNYYFCLNNHQTSVSRVIEPCK